jgi:hypothetical protein
MMTAPTASEQFAIEPQSEPGFILQQENEMEKYWL